MIAEFSLKKGAIAMLRQLKNLLSRSERVVFFGGAGVSTESGIPDFRSESGSFKALEQYGAPPEELLSRHFFLQNPGVFFRYYKENLLHPDALPNKAHLALARLERQGKLTAVITQNVDGLHQLAGSENVLELHGSAQRNYCMDCGARYPLSYIIDPACCPDGLVPRCSCGGVVRPDIVLYDELLDSDVMARSAEAIRQADTMVVGGTSLVVYPAAGLLRYFRGSLVLINRTPTQYDDRAQLVFRQSIGEVLSAAVEP